MQPPCGPLKTFSKKHIRRAFQRFKQGRASSGGRLFWRGTGGQLVAAAAGVGIVALQLSTAAAGEAEDDVAAAAAKQASGPPAQPITPGISEELQVWPVRHHEANDVSVCQRYCAGVAQGSLC